MLHGQGFDNCRSTDGIVSGEPDTPPLPAFLQIEDAACNFMQIRVEVSVGSELASSGRVRISIGRENSLGARMGRSRGGEGAMGASSARTDTWPQLGDIRILGWRWPVPRTVLVRAEYNADSDWSVPLYLPAKVRHVRNPAHSGAELAWVSYGRDSLQAPGLHIRAPKYSCTASPYAGGPSQRHDAVDWSGIC